MGKNEWEYSKRKGIMIHKDTKTRFDPDGYDANGFNSEKIHRDTRTRYDSNGYDYQGYNEKGFNAYGFKRDLASKNSINFRDKPSKKNEDKYIYGGSNARGFFRNGRNIYTKEDYDRRGFLVDGTYRETGRLYNKYGYNAYGYDFEGYDELGYDKNGYNREGRDIEGYNREGYDVNGYNKDGYDREGYKKEGYNKEGFDKNGVNVDGIHRDTGIEYDLEGYNVKGYNKDGYNREGKDKNGKTIEERKEIKQMQRSNWLGLRDKAEKLAMGQLSIEEYIMKSKTSISELIKFAKKEHMSPSIIRGLYRYEKQYKALKKPFNKEEYLQTVMIEVDGEYVKPTEKDVDDCVDYLKSNGSLVCEKTVRETISKYKRGELNITERLGQVEEGTKTQLETLEDAQKELQETLKKAQQLENDVMQDKEEKSKEGE